MKGFRDEMTCLDERSVGVLLATQRTDDHIGTLPSLHMNGKFLIEIHVGERKETMMMKRRRIDLE